MTFARKLWQRGRDLLPVAGFHFDRPLVLLQSDDWGRVGLRDQEGLEQLRSAGLALGERPYDFYTLETAEDLAESGRSAEAASRLQRPSSLRGDEFHSGESGLRENERREFSADSSSVLLPRAFPWVGLVPGLIEAYTRGIAEGVFHPALHGTTHFCRSAVERNSKCGRRTRRIFCARSGRPGRPTFTGACRGSGMNTGIRSSLRTNGFCPAETQTRIDRPDSRGICQVVLFAAAFGLCSGLPRQ